LDGDPTGGGAAGLVPSLHRCEVEGFQSAPCRKRESEIKTRKLGRRVYVVVGFSITSNVMNFWKITHTIHIKSPFKNK
jgi:hypothetical protein